MGSKSTIDKIVNDVCTFLDFHAEGFWSEKGELIFLDDEFVLDVIIGDFFGT